MKILVTGGAGFIGSHLADALCTNKLNNVIIFDNLHRGSINNIRSCLKSKNARFVKGDIRDYSSLEKLRNIDVVYHFGAQSNVVGSFFNPDYAFESNVSGTYNVLKFAAKSKIKKLIFSSSREVYGNPEHVPVDENHPLNPINIYGATKVCGEALCNIFSRLHGLKIVIVRMANVCGPRDKDRVIPTFLESAKANKNLYVYGGAQVLDFIWIGDVIKAIMEISRGDKYTGQIVNIGTGRGISIRALAEMIVKLSDSKSKIMIKKRRSFDVQKFIAKSNKFKMKTMSLSEMLKNMLE